MKKKLLFLLCFILLVFSGCTPEATEEKKSPCQDDPLGESCYVPDDELNFISPIPEEFVINEDFENEALNQLPSNWLLFKHEEYSVNGVRAFVDEEDGNRYVRMYSDGKQAPLYPQQAPNSTFIFTTKFNLDQSRKGIAYGSIMIPSEEKLPEGEKSNGLTLGLSTGAVNTISIIVSQDLKLSVKVGGPFFYHSGNGDSGNTQQTTIALEKDQWYRFRFEWDASLNELKAFLVTTEGDEVLYDGNFHISNRYNASETEEILVPNVFKVTMARNYSGWAFLDDVKVERKGE